MNKYGLHGKLAAKEGNQADLAKILLRASVIVAASKGCHIYLISIDPKNNRDVWVTEVWDTKEDHDNSLQNQKVKELITEAMPLLDKLPEQGQEFTILGGVGISE